MISNIPWRHKTFIMCISLFLWNSNSFIIISFYIFASFSSGACIEPWKWHEMFPSCLQKRLFFFFFKHSAKFFLSYLPSMFLKRSAKKKRWKSRECKKNEGECWNCFRNEEGTLDCDIKILLFFLLFLSSFESARFASKPLLLCFFFGV